MCIICQQLDAENTQQSSDEQLETDVSTANPSDCIPAENGALSVERSSDDETVISSKKKRKKRKNKVIKTQEQRTIHL